MSIYLEREPRGEQVALRGVELNPHISITCEENGSFMLVVHRKGKFSTAWTTHFFNVDQLQRFLGNWDFNPDNEKFGSDLLSHALWPDKYSLPTGRCDQQQ